LIRLIISSFNTIPEHPDELDPFWHKFEKCFALEIAKSVIMEKWKWFFVNGCECKVCVSTGKEFLKWCKDGTSESVYSGIMLKITIIHCNK
jgi:hypothetical protein